MIRRLVKAVGGYGAGQLVTDSAPEADEVRVRLVGAKRLRQWCADGIAEGVTHAKVLREPVLVATVAPPALPPVSLATARRKGSEAARAGLPLAACPYRSDTAAGAGWRDAWESATARKAKAEAQALAADTTTEDEGA